MPEGDDAVAPPSDAATTSAGEGGTAAEGEVSFTLTRLDRCR